MRKRVNKLLRIVIVIVVAFFAILLLMSIQSCEVLKGKQSASLDSTRVSRVDSGRVTTVKTDTKDSLNWWRETIEVLLNRPNGDTTIIMQPNITTPIRYIREGGNQVITQKEESNELVWRNAVDSLNKRLDTFSKSKETKFFTQWHIWAIIALFGFAVLKYIIKK